MLKNPNTPQKLFMTGASGHTGVRAARRLATDGYAVTCLSRNPESLRKLLGKQGEEIQIVEGSLGDATPNDEIITAAEGAAAIVHLANISFASQITDLARAANVDKIVCMSSTRKFTQFPDAVATRVIEGEREIEQAKETGLGYLILRPSMIYGDERDRNMEKLVRWLKRSRFMPLLRGGRNLVQPIYVDDLVDAISLGVAGLIAGKSNLTNHAITVAGPEALSWKVTLDQLGEAIGRRPIWIPLPYGFLYAGAWVSENLPGPTFVRRDQIERLLEDKAFDITEAKEALPGWDPRPFREGIAAKGRRA